MYPENQIKIQEQSSIEDLNKKTDMPSKMRNNVPLHKSMTSDISIKAEKVTENQKYQRTIINQSPKEEHQDTIKIWRIIFHNRNL